MTRPCFWSESVISVGPGRWSGQSGKELVLAEPFLHPETERQAAEVSRSCNGVWLGGRSLATFTEDLERLTDWLEQCGVTTVALESTGVYWIPLFEILEQRGIRPCLVNARHMKNVPGRRTDWHECQWLQFLHSVGLLRAAFRPGQDVCAVRTLLRHRSELVSAASQHVQHMHKALTQMNLQIHHVINDITGLTGLAIVDAILTGQRDGAELAKLRDPHIKADTETIRKSLEGNWRPEHLFTLRQSRELYRIYQQQIVNCMAASVLVV
jgi:transposase